MSSDLGPEPPGGAPQGPPNVYHPRAAASPAYEEYADPAAAHGWENAYDETRELPPVYDETRELPPVAEAGPVRARGSRRAPGKQGGRGSRARSGGSRGRRGSGRSRRVVVAVGTAGAVSLAALIAGFSLSGASSGGPDGKDKRTGPATGDPAAPDAPASSTGPAVLGRSSEGAGRSGTAPAGARPGVSVSSRAPAAGDTAAGTPSATAPSLTTAASTPASASTTGSARGNSAGRGHGKGPTKGPK